MAHHAASQAVVAAVSAVYSRAMPVRSAAAVFRIVSHGPAARLVIRGATREGGELIVIAGYAGPALPESLTKPAIASTGTDRWRLTAAEGDYDFTATGVDRIALRPALFEPMHARFALSRADRIAVRVLLRMLRFPGGTRILRWWQLLR